MKQAVTITALISIMVVLCSCSTGVMSPDDGNPTMAQSYEAATNEQTSFSPIGEDDSSQAVSSLTANSTVLPSATNITKAQPMASTLNSQFPTLPNPQSVMYIFGHYAGNEQLPVPGHFTAFPMYLETHYALPNEVQQPYNDGQFTGDGQDV